MNRVAYQRVPPEQHPVTAYLSRLSAESRLTMRTALAVAAYNLTGDASGMNELPWHRLWPDDMQKLRSWLPEGYAPTTVNRILAAVRGVLRICQALGYLSAEQQMRVSSVPPVPDRRLSKDKRVDVGDISGVLTQCHKDPRLAGRRDTALLALLYGVGLRASEIVALDLDDYSPTAHKLTLRQGKVIMNRQLRVSSQVARVLHHWLLVRGQEPGPFFVPISKNGRPQLRRLTTRAITWIFTQRAIAANVPPFSPRDVRRTNTLPDNRALSNMDPNYFTWADEHAL
jgi:integrase/recombinase XerD